MVTLTGYVKLICNHDESAGGESDNEHVDLFISNSIKTKTNEFPNTL